MKVFIEEYGQFLVAVLIGIVLFGILAVTTIENTRLMQKLIPDERNMALEYLKNSNVVDSRQIPQMNIVNSVVILINPRNRVNVDWMSPTIVKSVKDGQGHKVTVPNYVSFKDARNPDKLVKGRLNIIGTDAVNTRVKGDYKVTYQYENPRTGYKNVHDLIVCVRRPYIPHSYIKATGTQELNTGIAPKSHSTVITFKYKPSSTTARQDIVWTKGTGLRASIYIYNGYWYAGARQGDAVKTNIPATTSAVDVTLDFTDGRFTVGNKSYTVAVDNSVASSPDGYIQFFKSGQESGEFYSCQIYEGSDLVADFFPCYGKTANTFGLWNTVAWDLYKPAVRYPPFKYGPKIEE